MTAPTLEYRDGILLADGVQIARLSCDDPDVLVGVGDVIIVWCHGDVADLAQRLRRNRRKVGEALLGAMERGRQMMESARREEVDKLRASALRDFDQFMQVAALWRRLIQ